MKNKKRPYAPSELRDLRAGVLGFGHDDVRWRLTLDQLSAQRAATRSAPRSTLAAVAALYVPATMAALGDAAPVIVTTTAGTLRSALSLVGEIDGGTL